MFDSIFGTFFPANWLEMIHCKDITDITIDLFFVMLKKGGNIHLQILCLDTPTFHLILWFGWYILLVKEIRLTTWDVQKPFQK